MFYDYIHISAGLVANRDKQMRDDVILMLLSTTLKDLANELDIHISTATQLNGKRRNCHNTFLPVITGVHIY